MSSLVLVNKFANKTNYDIILVMNESEKTDSVFFGVERKKNQFKKVFAIGACAASLICVPIGTRVGENPRPTVSRQEIEFVDHSLDRPAQSTKENHPGKQEAITAAANECGLTLINSAKELQELKNTKDVQSAFAVFKEYLEKFGIKISIMTSLDDKDAHWLNYLDKDSFLSDEYIKQFVPFGEFKQSVATVMQSLQYTPKEYIELSGVKDIRVAKSFNYQSIKVGQGSDAMDAYAALNDDRIYISMYSLGHLGIGDSELFHEIGHFIDKNTAGYVNDNQFNSLNPAGFKYNDAINYEKYKDAVLGEYGYINCAEDKATILGGFCKFAVPELYSKDPYIRAKSRFLLARINEKVPNIAKYYGLLREIQ